jgi:hypothetical protein
MTPNAIRWEVPPLSTASVQAAIHYRDGIAALVCGSANAARLLAAAVALDPEFVLAKVGLAVSQVVDGDRYVALALPATIGRGERQHAETVQTALTGDPGHAADLRREHLLEFPGDVLIVWLPVLQSGHVGTAGRV